MSQFGSNVDIKSFATDSDALPQSDVVIGSDDPLDDQDPSDSVFWIEYSVDDPYSPYVAAYFSVQETSNGLIRIFYGWFETPDGSLVTLVEAPLFPGFSLTDLKNLLEDIPGIEVTVRSGYALADSSLLRKSGTYDATNAPAYFWIAESGFGLADGPIDVPATNRDVKFYLTSPEPYLAQNNPAQSLGGFISPSECEATSSLDRELSFTESEIVMSDASLSGSQYIQIQDEIIEIQTWVGNRAYAKQRNAFDTPLRVHFSGSIVRALTPNKILNSFFNENGEQYRCIAIRNESDKTLKKVKFFIQLQNRNEFSAWDLAVEIPRSDYLKSTATAGDAQNIEDSSLISRYSDDFFKTAAVKILTGQNANQVRLVTGYDDQTGIIALDSELPFSMSAGDEYEIDTAPAQRVPTGLTSPSLLPGDESNPPFLVTPAFLRLTSTRKLSIDVMDSREDEQRISGVDLAPMEAVYLWIKRSLLPNGEGQPQNRLNILLEYSRA